MIQNTVTIRLLGQQDYLFCWKAMQQFTQHRTEETSDEIWLVEHTPVFTQGQNGKPEHILQTNQIPIIQSDRGGQVTYHGPGQLMAYTLVDLKRKQLNVRDMVSVLEQSVIQLLLEYQITATAKREAPGVYINQQKICSVGLRIRRGCSYHGLAFNVAMDLTPFSQINPCGIQQLEMTQLAAFRPLIQLKTIETKLSDYLISNLRYTSHQITMDMPHANKNTG